MSNQAASKALDQYLVLDLTRARAGPTAARQLADFGARVIKIEMPGDPMYGDMGTRHGPDFQNLHRNKESMTLNLKAARGKEIFLELVKKADVVVENYRPQVKFNLGIDYESLKTINPRLVYASISGFGQDGPYANRPGLDQVAQGMGGHFSVTGEPGGGPVRSRAWAGGAFRRRRWGAPARSHHSPRKARLGGRADQDAASCCRRTLPDARRYFSSAALMGRVPKDMIRNTASAPVGNQS